MTGSSVTGIANHREPAPARAGRDMRRTPPATSPRPTDTMNAASPLIIV